MEEYFRIKYKDNLDANGIVVQVKGNSLRCLTGNIDLLGEKRCFLDKKGRICTGKEYFLSSISKKEAKRLISDYKNWKMLQNWAGITTDSVGIKFSKINKLERGITKY